MKNKLDYIYKFRLGNFIADAIPPFYAFASDFTSAMPTSDANFKGKSAVIRYSTSIRWM